MPADELFLLLLTAAAVILLVAAVLGVLRPPQGGYRGGSAPVDLNRLPQGGSVMDSEAIKAALEGAWQKALWRAEAKERTQDKTVDPYRLPGVSAAQMRQAREVVASIPREDLPSSLHTFAEMTIRTANPQTRAQHWSKFLAGCEHLEEVVGMEGGE